MMTNATAGQNTRETWTWEESETSRRCFEVSPRSDCNFIKREHKARRGEGEGRVQGGGAGVQGAGSWHGSCLCRHHCLLLLCFACLTSDAAG